METIDLDYPSLVPNGTVVLRYPYEQMNLRNELERLLVVKGFVPEPVPLEDIHSHVSERDSDSSTHDLNNLTKAFYETDESFQRVYMDVLKHIHLDILKYDFVFQTTPTIRFHTPGQYDDTYRSKDGTFLGYHVDSFNSHPFEEINFWLPLTECYGTNTLKMATLDNGKKALNQLLENINFSADVYYGSGWDLNFMKTNSDPSYRKLLEDNCHPIVTDHGELVFFDPRCIHSTTDNHEDTTRVSLDFRVIRVEDYENISTVRASQGRSGRKFTKGDIFFEKTIAEVM